MKRNDGYRNTERIDYLADFPGASRERDRIKTTVSGTVETELVDDINRLLGAVRPATGYTFPVAQDGPVDVSDRAGRALGAVSTPDQPGHDSIDLNETLAADGTSTIVVEASGVQNLRGTVVSTGSYDVDVEWTLSDGTTLDTVSVASGVAGGTPTTIDEVAGASRAVVTITDQSSAEQTAQGSVNLA